MKRTIYLSMDETEADEMAAYAKVKLAIDIKAFYALAANAYMKKNRLGAEEQARFDILTGKS